ncbi:MAG: DUF819 family protein [Acidobacteriota bacterium]
MSYFQDPMAVVAVCATVCAAVFWTASHPRAAALFRFVPAVVFIYYLPALLAAADILPRVNPAWDWMRDYLLPLCLFILMFTVDIPSILRIGPRAVAMMLFGSAGVVLGALVSYVVFRPWLPPEAWKAMAALSGSWIGGGGNFAAVKEAVGASDELVGPIIVVDTAVAYTWTGVLLLLAAYQHRFDAWNRADARLLEDLNRRLRQTKEQHTRPPTLLDLLATVGLGLAAAVFCRHLAQLLHREIDPWLERTVPTLASVFGEFTWLVLLITTLGIAASFTPLRRLEDAGASKLGYAALYLFLTSLGAKASLGGILAAPVLMLAGLLWILVHILVLLAGARALRAPLFLAAVGSQANVGGAATAPIVAAAYFEALAPVGVLMALLGYLVGTYGGLACAFLLSLLAGGES